MLIDVGEGGGDVSPGLWRVGVSGGGAFLRRAEMRQDSANVPVHCSAVCASASEAEKYTSALPPYGSQFHPYISRETMKKSAMRKISACQSPHRSRARKYKVFLFSLQK